MEILLVVYMIAGYIAAGKTIYANTIVFGGLEGLGNHFIEKVVVGLLLGWILIPVAIIKAIFRG